MLMSLAPWLRWQRTALIKVALLAATSIVHPTLRAADAGAGHPTFSVQVSGTGDPVILIPGLACGASVWDATVKQLAVSHRCYVLNLAGFGPVPPHPTESFLSAVRDQLIQYCESEGIQHPVIIGHSLGGFLALWVAQTAPGLPKKLILVDSLPDLARIQDEHRSEESIASEATARRKALSDLTPEEFAGSQKKYLRTMITSPEKSDAEAVEIGKSDPKTTGQAFYELMTTDLRPDLGKVTCPTLVISAIAYYQQFAPVEVLHAAYRQQYSGLKDVRFLDFDQSRHFVMVDVPELWQKTLTEEVP